MTIAKGHTIQDCLLGDIATVTTRHKTDEGYLDVHANISRAGIYEYQAGELGLTDRDPAQLVRVLRTDEEVFNEQSMGSFAKKPVTDEHPPALVDSGNVRFYDVGQSGEKVIREGDKVTVSLLVKDKKAVEKIEGGKVQLSCGYKADIVFGDGIDPKHGPYEAIQKNIRGNHIAIVDAGRAGGGCKIKDKKTFNDNKGASKMLIMFNDVQIEVTEAGKQAIESLQTKLKDESLKVSESMLAHAAAIKTLTTDHKATVDKLTGELDGVKKQIPDVEQLDAMAAERAEIIDSAKKIIKDYDPTGKSNGDIKTAVVAAKHTDMKLDGKSADYIDGLFDSIANQFKTGSDNLENLQFDSQDFDDGGDAVEKARKKMIDSKSTAWKGKQETA